MQDDNPYSIRGGNSLSTGISNGLFNIGNDVCDDARNRFLARRRSARDNSRSCHKARCVGGFPRSLGVPWSPGGCGSGHAAC
jgi:hypothetical protein